ncbi:MAG TPA: MaoC/PaaZ C-terminal domain-containing protein [Thermoleophilaceae bacterium]|jgi:acyl dehydratase
MTATIAPARTAGGSGERHGADAWLRPFDELELGDAYTSRGRTITEADVVRFAALSGDWHPSHGDRTWAEAGGFGERVAHGMLVLSYSIGLVPNLYVAALRRVSVLELGAPVRIGDTIKVEGEIVGLHAWTGEHGLVTGHWRIANQDAVTAMTVELEAVWRRTRC